MTRNAQPHRAWTLALLPLAFAPSAIGQQASPPPDTGVGRYASPDSQPMVLPRVKLAPRDGEADEQAQAEGVARRAIKLQQLAAAAADPLTKANFHLAAANWMLAYRIEPACSRYVLHVERRESAEAIREILPNVSELLDGAEASIGEAEQGAELPDGWARRSRQNLRTLRVFTNAIGVATSSAGSDDNADDARAAQSRLSILLEYDDPLVPAAAMLWSLELSAPGADPKRAMRNLDFVLDEPARKALPHAFYLRLARCRLIADDGGFSTALALLKQLEERCAVWLGEKNAPDALRTVAFVELVILRQWHDALLVGSHEKEREWCRQRFQDLAKAHFGSVPATVLRLGSVIPVFVELPEADVEAPPSP